MNVLFTHKKQLSKTLSIGFMIYVKGQKKPYTEFLFENEESAKDFIKALPFKKDFIIKPAEILKVTYLLTNE